ncbi:MAG TPA: anaerobic ribonucleoside-triphosphate reductase [Candidatus Absconditabacterales bacterium]|nr:anaerobic ribonucleoside-triphosphate reductase [Candidatus Absconditabacterales bacterium]HPK27746.1 anaerobic ribonucleoside-triphosphate reductase [Candidatus Absconditabacterales bacterium]
MNSINDKVGQAINRQPVQCYTRVMGYLRPVSCYNLGKKSEFYSRKYYDKIKAYNRHFVAEYTSDAIC